MLIGELSRLTGISTRMLRHYDSIGLVSPKNRSANGYRDYTPDDIRRLFRVESLRTLGLPLQAIRETLADSDVAPTALVEQLIASTTDRIAREQALLKRLKGVRDSEAASWHDVLDLVALLQDLDSPDPARRQRVALTGHGTVPATAIVETLLRESDPNVAGALQWSLARSVDDAVPHLIGALNSPDERTRHQAIDTIVKLRPADSASVLAEALTYRDRLIRARAAVALGSRGALDAVPELLDMVTSGIDDVAAAEILGRLAREHSITEQIAGMIAERLTHQPMKPARSRLTQALAEVPGPTAVQTLTALVDDDDPAVSHAARYLMTIRTTTADG